MIYPHPHVATQKTLKNSSDFIRLDTLEEELLAMMVAAVSASPPSGSTGSTTNPTPNKSCEAWEGRVYPLPAPISPTPAPPTLLVPVPLRVPTAGIRSVV